MSNYRRRHHDETTRATVSATWATDHARRYFADEIAIDFPSIGAVVERMRDELVGADEAASHNAAISVSRRDAHAGVTVPHAAQSEPVAKTHGRHCTHASLKRKPQSEPANSASRDQSSCGSVTLMILGIAAR